MQSTSGTSAVMPSVLAGEVFAFIEHVLEEIDAATHITLALPGLGEPWSAFCTDPTASALNEIEQTWGGPALDAFWSGRIARVTSTLRHVQWPEYVEVCKHHGVGSVLALPISSERTRVGVLTVAANDYCAFGPEETRIGVRAATRAAKILSALGNEPRLDA